ncbi:MAG: NADH-quinone oxidoreductase subunit NuoE [Fluviicoccus sp.]|uniref:NADH-quinone oxidoreductase subunit NuoE n=1 Tax=Fluviicoccus sp. TaxID=2003552 RepID=UPI0027289A61|nr:NADH-quinone oxidoreductase subunit NuoE [Fluviicoccus sp.]MDO8330155.1 NADH-quinone oxidoreductase subunit NuoE [Fluviicoccus sp.]
MIICTDKRPKIEPYELTVEERTEIEHHMAHYEDPRAATIDALKLIQKHHGWVSDSAIVVIGQVLGIPASDVDGVATFYNKIFRKPVGRNVIFVCDSIGCFLTGYEDLINAIKKHLNIEYGQTTADNRYTLLPICCLGNCDKGPTLMINEDTHGPVSIEQIPSLLEQYP